VPMLILFEAGLFAAKFYRNTDNDTDNNAPDEERVDN
jgi:Sec-independent protein secretion pathway component TatC